MNVEQLINRIQGEDEQQRADAWQTAGPVGASALEPLAGLAEHKDFSIERAAKRAMWKIVRHAGRPGADEERLKAVRDLNGLLRQDRPRGVRVEILWMLSELGGDESVDTIAVLLNHESLREDARMVLERIDGEKSLSVLKEALDKVPEDFQLNVAQSLRRRGVKVNGPPCEKLKPTKETKVRPVGR